MDCSTPGFPVHHQLPEYTQTHVHWVSDAIQSYHPLLSPPPTFNLSQHQGLFQWVGSSHQVAEILEFQLQHQSFQWIFRTDSFRMDWLDLLAVQGTLKSLLQHHSSEASVFWCSAFLFFVTPVEVLVGAVKVGRSNRVRDALLPSQLNLLMDWIQNVRKREASKMTSRGLWYCDL